MKLNIGVMFGGESVEHEVSVISALQAINAIDKTKYNVIPIYISKTREFYSGDELLDMETYSDLELLTKSVPQVILFKENQHVRMRQLKKRLFRSQKQVDIDVVIPVLHGTNGEDGVVQGMLEMLDVSYAGCDVIAAAAGQDKVIMKMVFEHEGLPIVPWHWFYYEDFNLRRERHMKEIGKIGYPVVVKPACLGSSIGITVAKNEMEALLAIETASKYDEKIVVEKAVENLREINCSVLGDSHSCKASVLEEVTKNDVILSFQDKYTGNAKGSQGMASTQRIIPARLEQDMTTKVQDYAIRVFRGIGAAGVCRIDFMIDGNTNNLYVNEINTIPGSLAFYLWSHTGVDFIALMDSLIEIALERTRRKDKMIYSYSSNILSNYSNAGSKGVKQ